MEFEIEKTKAFDKWLKKMKDRQAMLAILKRLNRVQIGNFGDYKSVGGGVSEMRVDHGPGYRLYYTVRENRIVFMLYGGHKKSQKNDIKKAKDMAKKI